MASKDPYPGNPLQPKPEFIKFPDGILPGNQPLPNVSPKKSPHDNK
jgi:hypothetical protein